MAIAYYHVLMELSAPEWSNPVRSGYSCMYLAKGRDLPARDLGLSPLFLKMEVDFEY